MALHGELKVYKGGTLETTPNGVINRALSYYGTGNTFDLIKENKFLFSLFMCTMININANERVDLTPFVNGYDEYQYSDCIGGKPAYKFIREKLVQMGFINGLTCSGVRFNDDVLTGGVEDTHNYEVNVVEEDSCKIAYCLNKAHVGGILDVNACTCPVVPCGSVAFNDYIFDFELI